MNELVATESQEIIDRDAVEIGELYAMSNGSLVDSIRARIECGRRLLGKKAEMKHGAWLPWLEANVGVLGFAAPTTAQRLMKIAASPPFAPALDDPENAAPAPLLDEAEATRLSRLMWGHEDLSAAVGTDSASHAERGNNLYETPAEAVHALLKLERFGKLINEPACGRGAIARILEEAGHEVKLADLVDYGTTTLGGSPQAVEDFLTTRADRRKKPRDIVTNPPYGKTLNAFVAHALREHRPPRMALLLNLNFLAGFDDDDRNFALDENPPARIFVFTRRLPMMHRDGWTGPVAASRMNTAWFVWEQDGEGRYAGPTIIGRVDWKDHQPEVAAQPAPAATADFNEANRAELEALAAIGRGVAVSGPLADALRASGLVLARRRERQRLTPEGEARLAELEAAAAGEQEQQADDRGRTMASPSPRDRREEEEPA